MSDSERNLLARLLSSLTVPSEIIGDLLQFPPQTVEEAKTDALESNLGEAANVAEIVAVLLDVVLWQADFHGNAVWIGLGDLCRQQPIIRPGRRPANLPHLTLLPLAASDQAHQGGCSGFDLIEFPASRSATSKSDLKRRATMIALGIDLVCSTRYSTLSRFIA